MEEVLERVKRGEGVDVTPCALRAAMMMASGVCKTFGVECADVERFLGEGGEVEDGLLILEGLRNRVPSEEAQRVVREIMELAINDTGECPTEWGGYERG